MSRYIPYPLKYDSMPVDISFVFASEKPAGKHGFIRANGSHFEFEDGTPARFWGVNFNGGACFPDFDYAEKTAKRLAMTGVNIVRFHQLDAEFHAPNIFSFTRGANPNTTRFLDPESMKRLDYLVKCLKDEGIYIYLDLNTYRMFKTGDGVENAVNLPVAGKPYCHFNRRMIELQKEFACQLWTHINPYTGFAYKDDPAFVMCETVNESNLVHPGWPLKLEPYCTEFRGLYRKWLIENNYEDNADTIDINDNKNPLMHTFKFELMRQFQQEMYDYMRGIGVKIPITGENVMTFFGVPYANRGMDFTDNHVYPNNIPCWNEQTHMCVSQAPSQMDHFRMAYLSCMRDLKRPFFVSEWDMSWPNDYRAESSILFAAIGAMQGWDGFAIHTYAYNAHLDRVDVLGRESSSPIGGAPMRQGLYTTALDPAKYGLFYHAALITRRGDVKESETSTEVLVRDLMSNGYPGPAALKHGSELEKIGILFEDEQPVADRVVDQNENVVPDGITEIRSNTGELYRNWGKGYGTINTDRTKVIYGFLGKNGTLDITGMSVESKTDFAVIALSSLTDDAIEVSDNLLLTTIGRARNTDMRYEDDQLYAIGHAPVVVEVIEAEVAIRTARKDLICWAVNAEGYFIGKVPSRYEDGCLILTLGQTMPSAYYLIQAE